MYTSNNCLLNSQNKIHSKLRVLPTSVHRVSVCGVVGRLVSGWRHGVPGVPPGVQGHRDHLPRPRVPHTGWLLCCCRYTYHVRTGARTAAFTLALVTV